LLHLALVTPVLLSRLPWWISAVLLAGIASLPGLFVQINSAWVLTGVHLTILIVDWLSLYLLPRKRRSFGPIEAPLMMLTGFRVAVTMIVGAVGQWSTVSVWIAIAVQLVLLAITLFGLWIEPFRLGINRQSLISRKLDPALPPIRVLHLADIHIERVGIREERLQELVDEVGPDVIIFSGDFINLSNRGDPVAYAAVREVIGKWRAPFGLYTVSGSPLVESLEMVQEFVEGLEVRWLCNESIDLVIRGQRLTIVGITCQHDIAADSEALRMVMKNTDGSNFRLLAYHSPDIAPDASAAGVDLYLCGHTHGGQIRMPLYGAVVTSSAWGKRYEMGRYQEGDMILYTSRGIGLEGAAAPRARFLCPPEIIVWELAGTDDIAR
jgi:uncharacterized protein